MKKPQTKGKPIKIPALESSDLWPTPDQVALIAATLARNLSQPPDILADAAIRLWLAARDSIQNARKFGIWSVAKPNESIAHSKTGRILSDQLERHFFNRDKFLQLMLPQCKNRAHELARIGKAYWRDILKEKLQREPTPDEIAEAFSKWNFGLLSGPAGRPKKETSNVGSDWRVVENSGATRETEDHFKKWYSQYKSGVRRAAGKASAKKAAEKKALNQI